MLLSALGAIAGAYVMLYFSGLLPVLTEWRRIRCPGWRKLVFSLMYPFFMASFLLSLTLAMSGSVEWKPIRHTVAVSLGEMDGRLK